MFNDIFNLRGLFNAIFQEEMQWYYLDHSRESNGVHAFPKGIREQVNEIMWLSFEFANFEVSDLHFSHYSSGFPKKGVNKNTKLYNT